MRLIDADLYKEDMTNVYPEYYEDVLDAQPTIDAVPVIRCKDCKFLETCIICKTMMLQGLNGYCGNAKREESEE